jgi:recombinational DNA repair protein (RecF pathway)
VLCPNCGRARPGARPVSQEALRYFRHFLRSNFSQASRAHPAEEILVELESLLHYYLTYLLERGLNTPSFLREIRQEPQGYHPSGES